MMLRRDRALMAVDIMLDVAFHAGRGVEATGAAEIADRLGAQRRGIEPVLQALSRARLLDSMRGPKGGYRLARAPRAIPLIDIVEAVTDPEDAVIVPNGRLAEVVSVPLWGELDAALREKLTQLTVGDLLRRAAVAGLRRPQTEPLEFAI